MRSALHKDIANELRRLITSGGFKPGERLPTEPDLEERFGASRNTIRLAVATLVHEGLIQLSPGRGMFVPSDAIPFIVILSKEEGGEGQNPGLDSYRSGVQAAGRKADIRDFEMRIEYPTAEVASLLEIDEDSQVAVRGSKRFIDDHPHSLQCSYYPMDIVRGTDIDSKHKVERGTIQVLRELGHEQVGYRDDVEARMPTPEERDFFKIGPGVPVNTVYRVAFSADRPIRLTVTTYAMDRNRLSYEVGTVPERHLSNGQTSIVAG
jgi:GntR family transcriptional regulator